MIEAQVIADSVSPAGIRLTTFKLRYPKFIHGEFMTHRVISRNASSSRAIPTSKLIEEVRSDSLRASPVFWGANQKGMQAAEELSDLHREGEISPRQWAKNAWNAAAYDASVWAERLHELGVHKQIVNRVLEPFSHINVVATATEWDNFFGLRLHHDTQPEMRRLAEEMWRARAASTPRLIQPGFWHLPFVDEQTEDECWFHGEQWEPDEKKIAEGKAVKISVARCARVSYESFETGGRSTVEEDLKLYDRLLSSQPLHASPAEHQAIPLGPGAGSHESSQCGNFLGWRQYRKMLPGERVAPLPEEYRG